MIVRLLNTMGTDPFYNIALEHALHELATIRRDQPILRFWRNTTSVILGRTQNIEVEVNQDYCHSMNIPVLRRISGGGTVYHDLGNLNTSIVFPLSSLNQVNDVPSASKLMTQQISNTLQSLGYDAISIEHGTNIFYQGMKISGSAGHLKRGWFLHHATLLLDTNIEVLNRTILARNSDPDDPRASRYFPTINLEDLSLDRWVSAFSKSIAELFDGSIEQSTVSPAEDNYARQLAFQMYQTDEWTLQGKRKLIHPE